MEGGRGARADEYWQSKYDELVAFQREHGHSNVPQKYCNGSLGSWVNRQRIAYRKKDDGDGVTGMKQNRIDLLEKIGFVWKLEQKSSLIHDKKWQDKYEHLKIFQQQHGHCNVPAKMKSSGLGDWVHNQRTFFKRGRMRQDRIDLLNKIGFTWKLPPGRSTAAGYQTWKDRFDDLKS